ncbi:MAG: translocation protein TolB [Chthoniobacter sp.]|uniref:TolB family protein n=1 Tax=Chthoniobacter sp. TaxID=2510640 RepID=UPI0032AC97C0
MLPLLFLLCGVLSVAAEDSTRKLAYERDRKVWVANLDGSGAKKIGTGLFPVISPDGTRVAFNTEEQTGKTAWARHIAVVDLASGKQTVFKDVPSENVYYPKWSPDGTHLAFTLYDGHNWHLVMINADGTGFRFIKKAKDAEATLYSPCWAPDGKSLFVEDMKNIYRIGLDGATIGEWNIQKSIPNGDMSGDGRLDVSPDGQKLLLGIDMNEEAHRKDWDGPLPAIWTLDLASKKGTRLTPKKQFGWDACWIDDSTLFFISQAVGEKTASLYKMTLPGGATSKAIAKDVRYPTVSR